LRKRLRRLINQSSPGAPSRGLRIVQTTDSSGPVLALIGDLDLATGPDFERRLHEAEQPTPSRILVDLSGLEFMDSTGLTVLVQALRFSEASGHQLILRRGPQQIQRLFDVTGIEDRFTFEA
jgi:anti-sigma B factor antagonist